MLFNTQICRRIFIFPFVTLFLSLEKIVMNKRASDDTIQRAFERRKIFVNKTVKTESTRIVTCVEGFYTLLFFSLTTLCYFVIKWMLKKYSTYRIKMKVTIVLTIREVSCINFHLKRHLKGGNFPAVHNNVMFTLEIHQLTTAKVVDGGFVSCLV